MPGSGRDSYGPVARGTPFDNSTNGFVSTDVQAAIEELAVGGGSTASPGFTFGRSGSTSPGTYLLNESVPSNVVGRVIFLNSPKITDLSIGNENTTTFTMEILEHDTTTYTSLGTFTVTAAKSDTFSANINVTKGKHLAVKVADSSANAPKNVIVNIQLRGTI